MEKNVTDVLYNAFRLPLQWITPLKVNQKKKKKTKKKKVNQR